MNQYLIQARLRKRWSVDEAHQRIGVSKRTYVRWENADNVPNMSSLDLLCIAFEAHPEHLGYIVEKHGLRLKPPQKDVPSPQAPKQPAESLALAQQETLELIRTSLQTLAETVTHLQEASVLPKTQSPLSPIPSIPPTPSSTSSQPLLSSSSFNNENPQGIISGDESVQTLNARNLSSSSLALSTDIIGFLKTYGTRSQEALTTCRQQIDIYETIEQRSTMTDEPITDLSQITRRDLFMLASVSSSLVLNMQRGWPPAGIVEEFLSEATASITTCWYLLQRSDGLPAVEWAIPQYLPELVEIVKHFPRSRQRAAYLAAQGFLLLSLIDLHRLHFAERVAHCQEAVTYARESRDLTLLIASLVKLSNAFRTNGQLDKSLEKYLEAERESKRIEIAGFSRGIVRSGLGHAYAKLGQSEEVRRSLDEAYATFTDEDAETPVFLSTSHGFYEIILDEGLSSLELGNHEQDHDNTSGAQKYYKDAAEKFGKMKQLPSSVIVPTRIAAEILIAQALAYAKAGDMEGFLLAFEKGVQLAMELGSKKRLQEVREALHAALEQWPNDQRITGLWELLI